MVVRIVWCVLNRLLELGHKQIMGNDRNARSAQHVNFLLIKNTAGMLGEFQCWSLSRKLVERKAFDFRSSVGLSCTMLISTDSSGKCSILFFLLLFFFRFLYKIVFYHKICGKIFFWVLQKLPGSKDFNIQMFCFKIMRYYVMFYFLRLSNVILT